MNAYELAEIVDKWAYSESAEYLTDAANMLRQQADRIAELEETIEACYAVQKMQAEEVYKGNDRIAELEKLLEHSVGSDCREMRYIQEIENKDVRIAELEKDGKVCATCGGLVYDPVIKQTKPVAWMQMHHKDNIPTKFSPVKVWEDDIPLYTTPQTNPLSYEEIAEIWKKEWQGGNIGHIAYTYARAIEERHGIK